MEFFFESLINLVLMSLFKTTAAANTGPAKQPRPTSSTPAIFLFSDNNLYIFKIFDFSLIIFKSNQANFFCSGWRIKKAG